MNPYYPALVDLAGKPCLVAGNGWAAAEKIRGLLKVGAKVTFLAAEASAEIVQLASQNRIEWKRKEYEPGDLDGFFLVISAPPDRAANAPLWEEANRRNILFNAVDDPARSNFILPAVHRQGDLIVAVSSSGRSPAVASRLRDRFANELGPEYGRFLEILGGLREEIAALYPDFAARRRVWFELVDSEALDLVRERDEASALRVLRMILDHSGAAGGGA